MRTRGKSGGPRPWLWLIALVGLMVPRRLRGEWRREWEAELVAAEAALSAWQHLNWRTRLGLLRHGLGSLRDALWLQPRRLEEEMFQDLRYGARMLLRQPSFTLAAALALALGIGASTLIFSVVNAVLLRPLPVGEADRVVRLSERHGHANRSTTNFTYANFLDLRRDLAGEASPLASISAARFWRDNLSEGGEPEEVSSMLVSADFFAALGVSPALGRSFLPEEDEPGRSNVVILSHSLWTRRYGADPLIIGSTIKVSGVERAVVGVLPPGIRSGFLFSGEFDLWMPLVATGSLRDNRRSHLLGVIARLRPEATIARAQAELDAFARRVESEHKGVDPDLGAIVVGLQEQLTAPLRPALLVLLGAVGCLLLIGCANVANLLLARSGAREREMAVRAALGASRLRLIRQMLVESVLLASIGGAFGLLLAFWGVSSLGALSPGNLPRLDEVSIDARVLAFALASSLVTGLIFGLAPALQIPESGLYLALREGGRGAARGAGRRLRSALVVAEVALAIVLLAGAGLLIKSFTRLLDVERGFNSEHVLTARFTLPSAKYRDGAQQAAFLSRLLERAQSAPGVISAGITSGLPLSGGPATGFQIAGRAPSAPGEQPSADIRIVDGEYFRALGIPLRAGRVFSRGDTAAAPRVMIINENMARRFWAGESPIGMRVTMLDWGPPLEGEIVGVVADVKADGLDSNTRPMIYWPYEQFTVPFNTLVLRTTSDPASAAATIKNLIWSIDPEQPIANIRTMDQVLADSVAPRRFQMLLLGIFAAIALALASVGVYGVMACTVSQRRQEIGIRLALGAGRGDVVRMVVGEGMRLVIIGVGVGLVAALALTRVMAGMLYGVSARDPLTFAAIALLLSVVAMAASYLPARRAARVNPVAALRGE